jgi:hypothetical protein
MLQQYNTFFIIIPQKGRLQSRKINKDALYYFLVKGFLPVFINSLLHWV